jgi:DNA-binding CsgD family transcriptional regulator
MGGRHTMMNLPLLLEDSSRACWTSSRRSRSCTEPVAADELPGRAAELDAVARLLSGRRSGIGWHGIGWHGPAGIGRSALLVHAIRTAAGHRVVMVNGTPAEQGLPLAGVHQVVYALRDQLTLLPARPRAALAQLLHGVGDLATSSALLTLIEAVSADRPLLIAVDDLDRLDRASTDVLGFVLRRCGELDVSVVATARSPQDWPIRWTELGPLSELDARRLLPGLEPAVQRRVVVAAGGLPLALVEYGAMAGPVVSDRLAAMFTELTRDVAPAAGLAAAFGLQPADATCAAVLRHPLGRAAIVHAAWDTVHAELWEQAGTTTEDAGLAATAWTRAADLSRTEHDRARRRGRAASLAWQAGRLDDAVRLGGPARPAYLAHRGGDLAGLADTPHEAGLTLLTGRNRPPEASPTGRLFTVAAEAVRCGLAADDRDDLLASVRGGQPRLHSMLAAVTLAVDRLDAGAPAEAESWARQSIELAETEEYRALAGLGRAVLAVSAAIRGQGQRSLELSDAVLRQGCTGTAADLARHARLLTALGRGDLHQAYAQASQISTGGLLAGRVLVDVVLACVHTGRVDEARARIGAAPPDRRLAATAVVEHDARAWFEAELDRPDAGRRPVELARIRLLYGEWLRRRTRDVAATRHQICLALDVLERAGAQPWADRARQELRATGLSQFGAVERPAELTEQEHLIAGLAAAGLTNKQIAARLVLSPRTVGAHLYKVFPKLGISSRGELVAALAT